MTDSVMSINIPTVSDTSWAIGGLYRKGTGVQIEKLKSNQKKSIVITNSENGVCINTLHKI